MSKGYARIDGLIATEANMVVLVRRGPSKWSRLYNWYFDDDLVLPGDWLQARVYSRRGDVSPDGKHVAHFAMGNVGPNGYSIFITAPPSFVPIASWTALGTWGGAGIWMDNSHFHAMPDPYGFKPVVRCPRHIKVKREGYIRNPEIEIHRLRLLRLGWTENLEKADFTDWWQRVKTYLGQQMPWYGRPIDVTKTFSKGRIRFVSRDGHEYAVVYSLDEREVLRLETHDNHPLWIDVDRSDRLVYSDKGRLYAWTEFPDGKPKLIMDLNTMIEDPPPLANQGSA